MKKFILISIGVLGLIGAVIAYLSLDLIVRREGTLLLEPQETEINQLAQQLLDSGYVHRAGTITYLAELKKIKRVRPGRYVLQKDEDWPSVLNRFRIGDQQPLAVVLPASPDLRRLSQRLSRQLMHDSTRFYNYFTSDSLLVQSGLSREAVHSLFLPNTYELYWTVSPKGLVDRMIKEREAFWHKRQAQLVKLGLNQVEVATLASIVERETNKVEEMPRVAGLYLNRLKRGWKLQSDPTALYGMQQLYPDSVVRRVLNDHLRFDSPWNTYLYPGLPPGPISIPSTQAIEAVLNAETHDYFYMIASVDRLGFHEFSKASEYARHQRLARAYHEYLNQRSQ